MKDNKLDSKRITRWLVSAESSAENIDGVLVATSHDDKAVIGEYISNLKWCIREVKRIKDRGGNAYTKKVGDYCAVYANVNTMEVAAIRDMEISDKEIKEMIEADAKKAA